MEMLRPGDIQRLQKTMAHARDESFFGLFRNLLRARIGFDTFLILRFSDSGTPQSLNAWLADHSLKTTYPQHYLDGTYRLDPFFQMRKRATPGALYRLSDIAPDRFFSGEYYLEYYRKTEICDEVGLLVDLQDGATGHLSMSRQAGRGRFRRRELQCLRHYSPVLLELLRQYCEYLQDQQEGRAPPPVQRPLDAVIRSHVTDQTGKALTRREAQLAALILQGHSNLSAALDLGISRETVKVHRRNIYRKLDISSQAELFAALKDLF
ncbi:Response regulator protein TmoT [Sulfitobacter sp. THAF37]|uniref:helix-turn-helix domain-containing protein n=1 Tax=Sulfitobacter sp. THAF37 TaxID=2587855 RepID=UPI0012AA5769|nr:helix-turn-helix transcriptional regulator [Sulfitobacter sp. THAF37]QFT58858.1 Response regulator protein TmoT [Sulfitobacter sp. THAF37]